MLQPSPVADFATSPLGRCTSGRNWLVWCADESLCGMAVWGRLDEGEADRLLTANQTLFDLPASGSRSLLADASRLERIDAAAFSRLTSFVGDRELECERRTQRQAFVRPSGPLGALIAGFYEVCGRPTYPVHSFTSATEALLWLGRQDGVSLSNEIADRVVSASSIPQIVRDLRGLLHANLRLSLATTARRLGTSERSLQRALRRAGTSFRAELDAARIRTAETLLLATDLKLTSIALEVGCASLQHFSTTVRRLKGQTPSAWRSGLRIGVAM